MHVPAPPPPTEVQPQVPSQPWTQPQPPSPWPGEAGGPPYGPGPGPYPSDPARERARRARRPRPDRRDDRPERSGGLPFGAGALVGVAGFACFFLGLVVLPWFTVIGRDVTLSDLRTAFTVPETAPEDLPGASEGEPAPEPGALPTPGEVGEAVEDGVRDRATQAAADAIDSGKARYLELYVERLWLPAVIAVGLAVVFSTILAPRSFALSLILGFRRLAGFVTVLVGAAHGAALWIVFTGDGAPDPAFGVWLGVGGLAAVLVGCILGPKR